MSQTLFRKSNILHIRTNEGEFEVSNPEVEVRGRIGQDVTAQTLVDLIGRIEWLGDVEFVFQHKIGNGEWQSTNEYYFIHLASIPGSQRRKLARLLPKEEFKPAQPTPNFPKGGTTLTESAYKELEGKGKLIGHIIDDFKNGKEIFVPAVESSGPQEKMSYWQYQQFAEAAITQLKEWKDEATAKLIEVAQACSILESENKALREEQERCLKALEQLANYNKNLLEEIERLKAEVKNANSALDNISDMGHA